MGIFPHIATKTTPDLFLSGCVRVMLYHRIDPLIYANIESKSVQDTDRG